MPTYHWVTPTAFNNPAGAWVNPAMAEDGNWTTYAYTNATGNDDLGVLDGTPWLYLILPYAMWINKSQFLYDSPTTLNNLAFVQAFSYRPAFDTVIGGKVIHVNGEYGYSTICNAALTVQGVINTFDVTFAGLTAPIYTDTLRVALAHPIWVAGERRFIEITVEQVVPDTITSTVKEGSNIISTRVSTTRHLTSLLPVIIG